MRIGMVVLTCVLMAGCVSMESPADNSLPPVQTAGMARQFISLEQVHKGMGRQEVNSILGAEVVVGYALTDRKAEIYSPLTVKNPFRSQTVSRDGRTYHVDYYLLGIRKADGRVSDDELVPLVFLNGKLIGSGWDFYHQRIKE